MNKRSIAALSVRCKPVNEWPENDQVGRQQALMPGDVIDGEGRLANCRPMTLRFLDQSYGRWLHWLNGIDELDPSQSPASRATPDRTRRYVEDLLRINRPNTVIGRLAGLFYMLRALDPDRDASHLRRAIARLRARHGRSRTDYTRIVAVKDLYQLGLSLMAAAADEPGARRRALRYRNGLLISVLAATPLRTADVVTLTLGKSFIQIGDRWWIDLCSSKTGEPIRMCLPVDLNEPIAEYLVRHRQTTLLERDGQRIRYAGQALWISNSGRPLSRIYGQVVTVTRKAFGKPVTPHLFRHSAATSTAVIDPGHVGIIAPLLAHRDPATSEQYYNLARNHDAVRRWQALIMALRE